MDEGGDIGDAIRDCLEAATRFRPFRIGDDPVYTAKDVISFYSQRGYQPVWVSDNGPTEAARELLTALRHADCHGLYSSDYHDVAISEWLKRPFLQLPQQVRRFELAALEVILSDAFVTFGNHLSNGKVDPVTIYPEWLTEKKTSEVFDFLKDIRTARDVRAALDALTPPHDGYRTAMAEACRLRDVIASGGWPIIPPGKTLRRGDRSQRVIPLRKRLSFERPSQEIVMRSDRAALFDRDLEKAVVQFQGRHGLFPDGAVGKATLTALNRSPEDLLETVLINMERWRWVPRNLGRRHIIVNAASFSLEAFEEGQQVLGMPIIVGEAYTQTPAFSQDMAYLVFNPSWNVPHGVLVRKILPKIKKDPAYLRRNHFELIKGWKEPPLRINPVTVPWSRVDADNFPGRLVQKPGPWNALGRVKFMFPNRFSVYLHDTPERGLFKRTTRAFSSGCIRVEDPVGLASFVLKHNLSWDLRRIQEVLEDGKTMAVPVQDDVTVHLVYWTFWAGEEGEPHYSRDIYDRDGVLWKALRAAPETPWKRPARPLPELDPNVGG